MMRAIAFGLLMLVGCGEKVPDYQAPRDGPAMRLVANLERPRLQRIGVTPLIALETAPCEFGPQSIIVVDGVDGTTRAPLNQRVRLTAIFERSLAQQRSSVSDTLAFTPKAGRSYRAEFIYLATGYSLRVFEDGTLLKDECSS